MDLNPGSSLFQILHAPSQNKSLYLQIYTFLLDKFDLNWFSWGQMVKECNLRTLIQIQTWEYHISLMAMYHEIRFSEGERKYQLTPRKFFDPNKSRKNRIQQKSARRRKKPA